MLLTWPVIYGRDLRVALVGKAVGNTRVGSAKVKRDDELLVRLPRRRESLHGTDQVVDSHHDGYVEETLEYGVGSRLACLKILRRIVTLGRVLWVFLPCVSEWPGDSFSP